MVSALVLVTNGSEEIETTTIVDVLRRSNITVTLVGVGNPKEGNAFICSRNVKIVPDTLLSSGVSLDNDILILPGGLEGAKTFASDENVKSLLQNYFSSGKIVAAICAAPMALVAAGIAKGSKATCYPTLKAHITDFYEYVHEKVVVDGNLITSRGPGTAFDFAFKIIELLQGKEQSDKINDQIYPK